MTRIKAENRVQVGRVEFLLADQFSDVRDGDIEEPGIVFISEIESLEASFLVIGMISAPIKLLRLFHNYLIVSDKYIIVKKKVK